MDSQVRKSLEDLVREALREGKEKEWIPVIQVLPLELKIKYREIWKEEMEKRKK